MAPLSRTLKTQAVCEICGRSTSIHHARLCGRHRYLLDVLTKEALRMKAIEERFISRSIHQS